MCAKELYYLFVNMIKSKIICFNKFTQKTEFNRKKKFYAFASSNETNISNM